MALQHELLERGRGKLKQIFTFLQALNELRNPVVESIDEQPWHLFLNELPDHPSVERGVFRDDAGDDTSDAEPDEAEGYVLKVARPELLPCPDLPPSLERWVRAGWEKFDATIQIVEVRHILHDG